MPGGNPVGRQRDPGGARCHLWQHNDKYYFKNKHFTERILHQTGFPISENKFIKISDIDNILAIFLRTFYIWIFLSYLFFYVILYTIFIKKVITPSKWIKLIGQ